MSSRCRRSVPTRFDRRYVLITVVYVAGVYLLSSIPDLALREQHPVLRVLSNLAHAPIFAGLAFCVLKTMSSMPNRYGVAFGITAVLALLDEWHQSFVPGRNVSVGDLLLDFAGIASVLLLVRMRTLDVHPRCEAE